MQKHLEVAVIYVDVDLDTNKAYFDGIDTGDGVDTVPLVEEADVML